jgi:predicted metalloprotease
VRRRTWTLVVVVLAIVGAGCTIGPGQSPRDRTDGGFGRGGTASRQEIEKVVTDAIADVERYWTATLPGLTDGGTFQPLRGGAKPYTRRDPPPPCGPQPGQYQPNAFYCPEGDFIAWDAELLVPRLHADFGALLVAVVMAHEYGHAIQARLNLLSQPTIVAEQQADCFAGGWIGDIAAGNSRRFALVPDELDRTLGGILMLRDQPGVAAQAPQAHGNAFDRVRALQEGVQQGASRCLAYRAGNLPVTEVPFTSARDAATGGDLPYDQAVALLSDDIASFWTRVFPQLGGRPWEPLRVRTFDPADPPRCERRPPPDRAAFTCTAEGYVAFEGREFGPALHERIGDNAVGMLLAGLFAQVAQERRGRPVDGREGQLAVDCLAGWWMFDVLHRGDDTRIRLSPGDLDEAVAALLAFGRSEAADRPSAFDRIAAFRNGVLQGQRAC